MASRSLAWLCVLCSLVWLGPGCGGEDQPTDAAIAADAEAPDAGDSVDGEPAAYAPADLDGRTVTFDEGSFTSVWSFPAGAGTSGLADLEGVGEFPFVYTVLGPSRSRLNFDVGGDDEYRMSWTSPVSGTFEESYDEVPGTSGTFEVTP